MKRFLLLLCLLLSMAAVSAASADVVISEVMALSGEYLSGNAYDWIELHNTDSKKADISGYCLSDDENDLEKWSFPSGASINAGGYILVYCTGEEHKAGKGNVFYSDFKISSSGETLFLSDGQRKAAAKSGAGRSVWQHQLSGFPAAGRDICSSHRQRPAERILQGDIQDGQNNR